MKNLLKWMIYSDIKTNELLFFEYALLPSVIIEQSVSKYKTLLADNRH